MPKSTTSTATMTDLEYKELDKAINLSLFGLIGIVFPVIGIILALVATAALSHVKSSPSVKSKKDLAQTLVILVIFLSLISMIGWYQVFSKLTLERDTCTSYSYYDKQQALEAGYTTDEINAYLSSRPCTQAL